jgi:hypothetical protein
LRIALGEKLTRTKHFPKRTGRGRSRANNVGIGDYFKRVTSIKTARRPSRRQTVINSF